MATYDIFNYTDMGTYARLDSLYGAVGSHSGRIVVPNSLGGKIVKEIGNSAFLNQVNVTEIDLTYLTDLTILGDHAFSGCSGITSMTIPAGITNLGCNTFYKCTSLVSVTLPPNLTNIGPYTFYNCYELISVQKPGNAGLPDTVTSIDDYAFCNCSKLTTVKHRLVGEEVLSGSVLLPENTLTKIGASAFEGCGHITFAEIPASVNTIGANCFKQNSLLYYITFKGNKPETIGSNAFYLYPSPIITIKYYADTTGWTSPTVNFGGSTYNSQALYNFIVRFNAGGSWKTSPNMYINSGGSWKQVTDVWANVNGTWKKNT